MEIKKIWTWINKNANAILAITTLISLIITISIASTSIKTQIDLANENIKFLKQTSSTNWAHLEINFGRPNEKRILVDAKDLSTPEKEITNRIAIPFVIINSGKVNSGEIHNMGYWSDKYIHTLLNKEGQSINVSAQSGVKGIIYLTQSSCSIGSEDSCNASKLPNKEYNLTLEISCEFCEPENRITNRIIPLCISHNNDEWNYCYNKYSLQSS